MHPPFAPLVLEGAGLRATLLPGKGAEIASLVHVPTGTELLARLRPTPPDDGTAAPGDEEAFNRHYAGGWQGILPNGDAPCEVDGVAHGFHGEAWARPFAVRDADGASATLAARLLSLPLAVERRLAIDPEAPRLVLDEAVRNEGDRPARILWGQHPAFGPPLVGEGATIRLPPCRVDAVHVDGRSRLAAGVGLPWPLVPGADGGVVDVSRVLGPGARSHDLCLAHGLEDGWYELVRPAAGLGVRVEFDRALFRWLWIWQLYGAAEAGEPFRDGYCLALEPFTGPPGLAEAVRRGEELVLGPGEDRRTRLVLTVVRT